MYHFTAENPPEPVRLSFRALVPGHIRQYLKDFQIGAIRFMHNFLAKGEFCVYNDESGLGKQAAVAVLLDASCSNKKCLIVVQNDERYVNGWEFHFNVLTKVNAMVIKDAKDSTDSPHNIYIAKWSTLRIIGDLSKLKFDFIILDNRGQMLNNSFCTSMLMKHYERKINILISSVDITSDLKLLHNVLRLGGRLDPQYSSFKIFEEKFKLPDVKELTYKRVDLEEYFCKRERLADYCKGFRLRRYCHQYENVLPLVKEDRYKINIDVWREKQNATNSESSSVEYVMNHQRSDEHVKDTQELFEEYCRQRRKEHLKFQEEEEKRLQQREQEMLKNLQRENEIIYNVDDEVALINDTSVAITEKNTVTGDNSDEPVLMSPLLVESDSDTEDLPQICNDPIDGIEIVDLSSDEKDDQNEKYEDNCNNLQGILQLSDNCGKAEDTSKETNKKTKSSKKRNFKKRTEVDKLEEDIVDALKLKPKMNRSTRQAKEDKIKLSAQRVKAKINEKVVNKTIPTVDSPKGKKSDGVKKNQENNNLDQKNIGIKKSQKSPKENANKKELVKEIYTNTKVNQTSAKDETATSFINSNKNLNSTNKKTTTKLAEEKNNVQPNLKIQYSTDDNLRKKRYSVNSCHAFTENDMHIKKEVINETTLIKRSSSNERSVNSKNIRFKREHEITPSGAHNKHTRSMQRLTRSGGGSKYLTKNLSLQIDKIAKPKKKIANKLVQKATADIKKTGMPATESNSKVYGNNTQASVISHKSSQDYESIQCAQRLSDVEVLDNVIEKPSEFLVPPTPNVIKNSLLPSSLISSAGFFAESDVIFVPPSNPSNVTSKKKEQVIYLSSSDNENSTSQSSLTQLSMTSRRTRALKPRRVQPSLVRGSNFSELLAQQNKGSGAKSPDLFSNCSDLMQLPCTQPPIETEEPNAPFEGFKIFGSEVKQLQQHYASAKNSTTNKQSSNSKRSYRDQRSCLDILEKMFEPSNKKQKQPKENSITAPTKKSPRSGSKPQSSILPSHPVEAITEARNIQEQQKKRKRSSLSSVLQDDDIFEITNNGTFGSVMRLHSNGDISPVQHTQKSNSKQHNKITNYLIGNSNQNACSGSQDEVAPNSGNSGGNGHMEAGTPSKRSQMSSTHNAYIKKSPKGKCSSTQTTKLTKWFTKPSDQAQIVSKAKILNSKRTPTKQIELEGGHRKNVPETPPPGKRLLKRRRLDLSCTK